jgi:hypothetical protein
MKLNKNNYPSNDEGRPDAADRYLARFKERGLKMKGRTRKSDAACPLPYSHRREGHKHPQDHAFRSKPNHAARFQNINEVFPPLASLFMPKEAANE